MGEKAELSICGEIRNLGGWGKIFAKMNQGVKDLK